MFKKKIQISELIKQIRHLSRKKGHVIDPKTVYNRKNKKWKKEIE
jgi:hypothetical protein